MLLEIPFNCRVWNMEPNKKEVQIKLNYFTRCSDNILNKFYDLAMTHNIHDLRESGHLNPLRKQINRP